jgi:hypothetical protein
MATIRRGPRPDMYSGRELELDLLGKPRFPREFNLALKQIQEPHGYASYNETMELIRRFYPEDPTNPGKEFLNELRLALMEKMGVMDGDEIRAFSAVGTPLDIFHGVDGWIEVAYALPGKAGETRYATVTLDASLRPEKLEEGHKADIVVGDMPEPSDPRFLDRVGEIADEVMSKNCLPVAAVVGATAGG